jgi:flavin reductase (DIM6/NTAB) family NADH-FMN oxidoreductase RutF
VINTRSTSVWGGLVGIAATALVVVPLVSAHDGTGFDGYIQSGTCAEPTADLVVNLDGEGDRDIEPYVAVAANGDEVTLGFFGAPGVPGFGVSAIYTDQRFSMVITDENSAVACGDILEPEADKYGEAGVAMVQLLPVGSSAVHGVAAIDRAVLERELDVTPTRVRVVLSDSDTGAVPSVAAGFDELIQSGSCASPSPHVRVQVRSRGDHDVAPFQAQLPGTPDPVTVAYYGAPEARAFSIGAAYTDHEFSLALTDTSTGALVACGDILEPEADRFTEAGIALVQLLPVANSGVEGFALIERTSMERELDITPTRVRTVVFAPPVAEP